MVNNIPPLKIGNIEAAFIQGGMGVKISGAKLAAAVANEGGIGTIASVGLGLISGHVADEMRKVNSKDLDALAKAYALANSIALREEINEARRKTNGIIAVNIMHALSDYSALVKTAVDENIDMIISGAGIPRDLPAYIGERDIKLVPIVSTGRVTEMICKSWKKFNHLPDAIIVEGPKAGGHLGYSREELLDDDFVENGLERRLLDTINVAKQYGNIPVIAAGGIFYGKDIRKYVDLGAAGVQMATRFVATDECDADSRFKQAYIDSQKEDIVLVKSPVGMPGRAVKNKFLEDVEAGGKVPFGCAYQCLKPCKPEESPYCIALALVNAQKGELTKGFAFAGTNAYKCKEIIPVKKLVENLDREYSE